MTLRRPFLAMSILLRVELDQAWEQQDHVSAFVHDGAVAEIAPHLAWELMADALVRGIVPLQVMMTREEIDVFLVENRSPLERCSWIC